MGLTENTERVDDFVSHYSQRLKIFVRYDDEIYANGFGASVQTFYFSSDFVDLQVHTYVRSERMWRGYSIAYLRGYIIIYFEAVS